MQVLGIDIGGSGIKGAVVDTDKGLFLSERIRIPTPNPANPAQLSAILVELVHSFAWKGLIGCGFPAVIQHGIVRTAANIDNSWIGINVSRLFSQATGCEVIVLNDADAAAFAEFRYGAGRGREGQVVMMITLGTGIGTALFCNGVLFPNTELGHLVINGVEAEHWASSAVRKKEGLSWKEWAARLQRVLTQYHDLFWPDCMIIGGGISKKDHKFFPYLHCKAELLPAQLRNQAGIIGAAAYCLAQ